MNILNISKKLLVIGLLGAACGQVVAMEKKRALEDPVIVQDVKKHRIDPGMALIQAVRNMDIEGVIWWLDAGADIRCVDSDGKNAEQYSVINLLQAHADDDIYNMCIQIHNLLKPEAQDFIAE